MKCQEGGENRITRSFEIRTLLQIWLEISIRGLRESPLYKANGEAVNAHNLILLQRKPLIKIQLGRPRPGMLESIGQGHGTIQRGDKD